MTDPKGPSSPTEIASCALQKAAIATNPSLLLKSQMTGTAKIYCGERRVADLMTRRLARFFRVEFWSWW